MAASLPAFLRGLLVWLGVLSILLGVPSVYAMNWPPAVIVQSSSMAHPLDDVPYGRVGTLDPGDLVLVKRVTSPDEVRTFVEGARERYKDAGDVIVYYPANQRDKIAIIHRAMAFVDVEGEGPERVFRVRWDPSQACEGNGEKDPSDPRWCIHPAEGILIPSAGIQWRDGRPYQPNADGFITKGDNPLTNRLIDPAFLSRDENGKPSVVPLGWIEGKARGEVPWLGLIKLAMSGEPNEEHPPASYVKVGSAYAPKDLWVSLAVALAVLLGGPVAHDAWKNWKLKRQAA